MKKRYMQLHKLLVMAMLLTGVQSCKNTFDVPPEDAVGDSQMYRNVFDADAVIIGLYGKLSNLAANYVILNDLRADLTDLTSSSDRYLIQVNNHHTQPGNPYVNPRPYYELILTCNDALENFGKMRAAGKLKEEEYTTRYSDVAMLRTWLYLQLGIQFGTVPYVTKSLEQVDDVNNASLFPRIGFDALLDTLINFSENLPFKREYPTGTTLLTAVDGYNTQKMFVPKEMVFGDLHLWKGNYTQAATYYRRMLEKGSEYNATENEQYYETYRITYQFVADANWIRIFANPFGERYTNYENIWMLPFDKTFKPANPFIPLMANEGAGKYQVMPSQLAIKAWDSQMRADLTPFDRRGRESSYTMETGVPVINKQIPNYNVLTPFETTSRWTIYRAAALHLRFAEAANRDGHHKLAYALVNGGFKATFDPTPGVSGRDVTNIMNTLTYPAPYNFDAREGEYPRYRGDWYRNDGLRGRQGLTFYQLSAADSAKYFDMSEPDPYLREVTDHHGLALYMEDMLVKEDGLELAFEGYRWQDLLRIALRRDKEAPGSGGAFMKKIMDAKFTASGQSPAVDFSNPANWFLPFDWNSRE